MKTCSRCKTVKPLDAFSHQSNTRDKHAPWCRDCKREDSKLRHKANPEKQKIANWKYKYGLTPDEYWQRFKEQNGLCAICSKPPEKGIRLAVDHDHETDEVRGLLCKFCNWMLGMAQDNPDILNLGIKYLQRYKKENS